MELNLSQEWGTVLDLRVAGDGHVYEQLPNGDMRRLAETVDDLLSARVGILLTPEGVEKV